MCALILWRPDSVLLMGKFRQFLTELSAYDTSIFSFQDNNLSKSQQNVTKTSYVNDIVEICFGIAIGYISSISDELSTHDMIMAGYYLFMFLFPIIFCKQCGG